MRIILLFPLFILASCANYSNKKHVTTTMTDKNGVITVVDESCETTLSSMREFSAGDLTISKNCTVTGSAKDMQGNEKAYDAINALIGKIP